MSQTDQRHTASASPPATARRVALSRHGEEILRAVVPAVLGPLLPLEQGARAAALDAGLASLDDYLAYLSPPLQREARFFFRLLDLPPVRLLLVGTWSRWPAVAPARVEAFLCRARHSRLFLLRRVHAFLQSMAVLAWFDLPIAWNQIGYPGPPIERPARSGVAW